MKTQKAFLAASAVALGLVGYSALSQAFDGAPSPQTGRHCQRTAATHEKHGWERMADRLKLTEAQRSAVTAIRDKYQPAMRAAQQQISANRTALEKAAATDAKLPELAAAQGKAIADMIVARKQMRAEMNLVLTDVQRESLNKLLEQRKDRQHRHERMYQG